MSPNETVELSKGSWKDRSGGNTAGNFTRTRVWSSGRVQLLAGADVVGEDMGSFVLPGVEVT